MKKSYNKAFTLVELLAVIVILAIILVIAVPKIMDVINSSKKSTLETSVKMIASTAEKTKMQNTVLGKEDATITCDSVAKLSSSDYANCSIKFDGNTAKVTVKGKGKFEGLSVCGGTKNEATAQEEDCPLPVSFANDTWPTIIAAIQSGEYPYQVGDTKEVELKGFTNGEEGSNDLYTLRIANTTPCSEVDTVSKTACGFVLEFADIITNHVMNSTDTNVGGWPASAMRTYVNDTIYNSLPIELKNAIINTTVVSGHGYNDTTGTLAKNNFESIDKLYLLLSQEVFGSVPLYESVVSSRTLDIYEEYNEFNQIKNLNGESIRWWLRSADSRSTSGFFLVRENGFWGNPGEDLYTGYRADRSYGVSPAFRLSD